MESTSFERRVPEKMGKSMANSAFRPMGLILGSIIETTLDETFIPYVDLAVCAIRHALLDAETEVRRDPDRIGPDQQAILDASLEDSGLHVLCQIIDVDPDQFVHVSCHILDRIADTVRAERVPNSNVVTLRRTSRARRPIDRLPTSSPFHMIDAGRHAGQMAMAI